ncbi:neurofibromin-like [Sycon ciliatum]|uniref:neurofibromin-like n=1 Tax=Sycon ciliatum TaxID=27933 RepID=UPI0031F70870
MPCGLALSALERFEALDPKDVDQAVDFSGRGQPDDNSSTSLLNGAHFVEQLKIFSEASLHDSGVVITRLCTLLEDSFAQCAPPQCSHKQLKLLRGLEVAIIQLLTSAGTAFPKDFYCETNVYGMMGAARYFTRCTYCIVDYVVPKSERLDSMSSAESSSSPSPPRITTPRIGPVAYRSRAMQSLCSAQSTLPELHLPGQHNEGPEDDDSDGGTMPRRSVFRGDLDPLLETVLKAIHPIITRYMSSTTLSTSMMRVVSRIVYVISAYSFEFVKRRICSVFGATEEKPMDEDALENLVYLQHAKPRLQDINDILKATLGVIGDMKRLEAIVLAQSLHQLIWNWFESSNGEFALVTSKSCEHMDAIAAVTSAFAADLFEVLDTMQQQEKKSSSTAERRRTAFWPVMTALMVLAEFFNTDVESRSTGRRGSGFSTMTLEEDQVRGQRFWQKVVASLRSGHRSYRDGAVVCCVSVCRCASMADANSPLRMATTRILPQLVALLFTASTPLDYIACRPTVLSPIAITSFELQVVTQLAYFNILDENVNLFIHCLDTGHPTMCLVAVCSLHYLVQSGVLDASDSWAKDIGWKLRRLFMDSSEQVQKAFDKTKVKDARSSSMFHSFTSKVFRRKSSSLDLADLHGDGCGKRFKEQYIDRRVIDEEGQESKIPLTDWLTPRVMLATVSPSVLRYYELVETIRHTLDLFTHAPSFAMVVHDQAGQDEIKPYSCCRYLVSSMHKIMEGSICVVPQFLVPLTELMAVFHGPDYVNMWDPFSAKLWVGVYMVLETTCEFLLYLCRAILNCIDEVSTESLLRSLYKLLFERNVFIRQNFNEVVTTVDVEFFSSSLDMLEALLLVGITHYDAQTMYWSVLCLDTLVALIDSLLPFDPWITGPEAMAPAFRDNLTQYRAIIGLQRKSAGPPPRKAILDEARLLDKHTGGIMHAWQTMAKWWRELTAQIQCALEDGASDQTEVLDSVQMKKWTAMTQSLSALSGALPVNSDNKELLESEFLNEAMSLLSCTIEGRAGNQIQTITRIALENISPSAIPKCLNLVEQRLTEILEQVATTGVTIESTLFVEQVTSLLKPMFETVVHGQNKYMSFVNVETIVLHLSKYIAELSVPNVTLQIHLCRAIQTMMSCRSELFFRREHYFCNCLGNCLIRWLGRYEDVLGSTSRDDRDLLMVCVAALGQLFADLVVDETVVDEPAQLVYNRYWDTIEKIIAQCTVWAFGPSDEEDSYYTSSTTQLIHPRRSIASSSDLTSLHQFKGRNHGGLFSASLQGPQFAADLLLLAQAAMSNLLCADTKCSLVRGRGDRGRSASDAFSRVIKYCDFCHVKCRAYFMENMTAILRQGSYFKEPENMATMHLNNLCSIIVSKNKSGRYPIADVLMKVTSNMDQDELCTVLARLFYSRGLLYDLVETFFMKELQKVVTPSALFRSATHATRMVSSAMKHFGRAYAKMILTPILEKELETFTAAEKFSYEIDPNKLRNDDDHVMLEKNRANVLSLTKKIFDAVTSSLHSRKFPKQLVTICHCLLKCTFSRFPTHCDSVVGNAFFLRFLNPMLTQPQKSELLSPDIMIPSSFHRGLVLVAKTLQNIGNQLLFRKEKHMLCFNDYLQSVFPIGKEFLTNVSSLTAWNADDIGQDSFELEERDQRYLQIVLWTTQEKIGYKIYTSRKVPDGHHLFQDLILCLGNLGVPPGLDSCVASAPKLPTDTSKVKATKSAAEFRVSTRVDSGLTKHSLQKCFSRCTIGESQHGIVLSLAMHNMTSSDAKLRMTACNLMIAGLKAFNLDSSAMLHCSADTPVLLYSFGIDNLCTMSTKLATSAPLLTLEIWRETMNHCLSSSPHMISWSLKILKPWIQNFVLFSTGGLDDSLGTGKEKATILLDHLINFSISESTALYSSIIEHIWQPMAKYRNMFPLILKPLVQNAGVYSLGTIHVERACGIVLGLTNSASSNAAPDNILSVLLDKVFLILQSEESCGRTLENLDKWTELSFLAYFVCSCVLEECFDVVPLLPRLFHMIICLNQSGCMPLQEALHGLTVNILHALYRWSIKIDSDCGISSMLHVRLDNLIQQHYFNAFGVGEQDLSDHWDFITNHQMLIGLFLDVLKAVCNESQCNELVLQWERLAEKGVLSHKMTTFLTPCLTILAMISTAPESYYNILLQLLHEACQDFLLYEKLICAILGTLANILHRLDLDFCGHAGLFWLAMSVLQLNYLPLYCFGLDLMLACLHALDATEQWERNKITDALRDERLRFTDTLDCLDAELSLWQPYTHFTLLLAMLLMKASQDKSSYLIAERVIFLFLRLNKDPAWSTDCTTNPAALSIFSSPIWPFVALLLPFNEEARNMVELMSGQGQPVLSIASSHWHSCDSVLPAKNTVQPSMSSTLLHFSDHEAPKGKLSPLDTVTCLSAQSMPGQMSCQANISLNISETIAELMPPSASYANSHQTSVQTSGTQTSDAADALHDPVHDDLLFKMLSTAIAPSNQAMQPVSALETCKIFENDDIQILVTYLTACSLVLCKECDEIPNICDYIVAFSTHFNSTFSSICDVVSNLLSDILTSCNQISSNHQVLALVNKTAATPCDHNSQDFANPIVTGLGFRGAAKFFQRWQTNTECCKRAKILGSFVQDLIDSA